MGVTVEREETGTQTYLRLFECVAVYEKNSKYEVEGKGVAKNGVPATNDIIICNTNAGSNQRFRVTQVHENNHTYTFKAEHIALDSQTLIIADSYVVNKNVTDALNYLNNAAYPASPFHFTVNGAAGTPAITYRCVRTSLWDAILEVVERAGGGTVTLDGENIIISLDTLDYSAEHELRYAKNIVEIEKNSSIDELTTILLPVGKDGTLLNAVQSSASIYINAPDASYNVPFARKVEFQQDIERDNYSSDTAYKTALVNDLRRQATAWIKEHQYPTVDFQSEIFDTDFDLNVGDYVRVVDLALNVNAVREVVAVKYDVLAQRIADLEIGNVSKKLSDLK